MIINQKNVRIEKILITIHIYYKLKASYWPVQVYKGVWVLRSHKRTVVSPEPLAKCLPSGLNDTLSTASLWPAWTRIYNILKYHLKKNTSFNGHEFITHNHQIWFNFEASPISSSLHIGIVFKFYDLSFSVLSLGLLIS